MTQRRKEKKLNTHCGDTVLSRLTIPMPLGLDDNGGLMTGPAALSTQTLSWSGSSTLTGNPVAAIKPVFQTVFLLFFTMLIMPPPTTTTKSRSSRKCLTNHPYATKPQPLPNFFTFPPEIRLAIYVFTFTTSEECTLRRLKDIPPRRRSSKQTIIIFPSSILQTNKTIHTEALPIFYASQTFHYSTELNGLFGQPAIPNAYLGWVKHMSIDITVARNTLGKIDSIIAIHTQAILKHCSRLNSFTLHIIKAVGTGLLDIPYAMWKAQSSLLHGASAELLKTLRSRVQELSIVYLGKWHTLHELRMVIADDEDWVQEDRTRWYCWPALSLTRAQNKAVRGREHSRWTDRRSRRDTVHPEKRCIRVFRCRRARDDRESRGQYLEEDVDY